MYENHESRFFDVENYQEDTLDYVIDSFLSCNKVSTEIKEPEHSLLQPPFNWLPINLSKKNFQLSTQNVRTPASSMLKKTYHSPFPEFNVKRRSDLVATDNVYSETPEIDDGSTYSQLFIDPKTLVTDTHGIKTEKKFVNTLKDNIRIRGAMNKLI